MHKRVFEFAIAFLVIGFTAFFFLYVAPPAVESQDILGAFGAGFVNPFATGYSVDVFCCWGILLVWVLWESKRVRYGWICVLLGVVPGVAVGLGAYLLVRMRQLEG